MGPCMRVGRPLLRALGQHSDSSSAIQPASCRKGGREAGREAAQPHTCMYGGSSRWQAAQLAQPGAGLGQQLACAQRWGAWQQRLLLPPVRLLLRHHACDWPAPAPTLMLMLGGMGGARGGVDLPLHLDLAANSAEGWAHVLRLLSPPQGPSRLRMS